MINTNKQINMFLKENAILEMEGLFLVFESKRMMYWNWCLFLK